MKSRGRGDRVNAENNPVPCVSFIHGGRADDSVPVGAISCLLENSQISQQPNATDFIFFYFWLRKVAILGPTVI